MAKDMERIVPNSPAEAPRQMDEQHAAAYAALGRLAAGDPVNEEALQRECTAWHEIAQESESRWVAAIAASYYGRRGRVIPWKF